ncbi:hypothetical protein P170DRAFT_383687 [Aspergillus steynii IBT 23096]|uniref:Nitrate reductase [NADPH] n=1 Tax=Aspergillus steynii IBT 23096 TaxID=1392250 RepID=A0A2I2G877_9EURO|nr:uncharacterized protein P170DRAFT_383687 [Aspergillus steynii IBT 23096]PLB49086.1 hypothetical protein P170DRAFT_383687 [Aspergillus steynii IBT 23096]
MSPPAAISPPSGPSPNPKDDIFNEPDWNKVHSHRIGLRNKDDRFPGLTHDGDDPRWELEALSEKEVAELQAKKAKGELLTVRDFMQDQRDFHITRPDVHPQSWRYVLHTTEDFIKYEEDWPINKKDSQKQNGEANGTQANGANGAAGSKYTPEEELFLKSLQEEERYFRNLKINDGKGVSPVKDAPMPTDVDDQDKLTPDNWVPRSDQLIRQTGAHPLNAEPNLAELLGEGLITPSRLHYVRSHGPVPHLLWENHQLEISAGKSLTLYMDDLVDKFQSINIPILLACDGNRRKEVNWVKQSMGFNWGAGAVSCAYWKGVLLRDVLIMAEIDQLMADYPNQRLYVNFQGSETLPEGKYETSIPLDHIMDPNNDVLLAYGMNDNPLPADHGYPVRLIVPGFVGGRCVKWLQSIWVTDQENDSHYHIYDNRVVPSFVEDRDSDFGKAMYNHPSTACMEQMLNSVIARPDHGEKIDLSGAKKGGTYRVQGYAYNGGGNEIQRVEISLDGGKSWLYCTRQYPDAPLRHGRKFWTWLHWHKDLPITDLLPAESITVRCWDANKNTQPENIRWNLEGMMNNAQFVVKSEIVQDPDTNKSVLQFRHPTNAAGDGGWMTRSRENQIHDWEQEGDVPTTQYGREEIEKHSTEEDCWLVINNKVYDATPVLGWHPGGKAAILAHAGRVHLETTEQFESIHDAKAHDALKEHLIGVVSKNTQDWMKQQAEEEARKEAENPPDPDIALKRHKWIQGKLLGKTKLSDDTNRYKFSLPDGKKLGLESGQHVQVGFHFEDKLVFRSYTPVRPVLEEDEDGTFDLVVKIYKPDLQQPGGTMSNILDCLREHEEIDIAGPTGEIRYQGNGDFLIDDTKYHFDRIQLILGGSGITPGYQIIAHILSSPSDKTQIKVLDANKTENDILLYDELTKFEKDHPDQLQVYHVLSRPDSDWTGLKGHVDADKLHKYAFPPDDKTVALLCGPSTLVTAVDTALEEWGYNKDKNVFGF